MAYRCTGSFAFGQPPRVYAAGSLVGDDDPILRTHGTYFESVDAKVRRQEAAPRSVSAAPVETADAVPGEVRQTSVTRKLRTGKGDAA